MTIMIKLVVTGSLDDPEFLALKKMAEEKFPTQTWPVKPVDHHHSNQEPAIVAKSLAEISNSVKNGKTGYTRKVIPGQNTVGVLMGFLANKKDRRASKSEIEKEFDRVSYNPKSASSAISMAKELGYITRDEYNIVTANKLPTNNELKSSIKQYRLQNKKLASS